jgi:hypothetical protein
MRCGQCPDTPAAYYLGCNYGYVKCIICEIEYAINARTLHSFSTNPLRTMEEENLLNNLAKDDILSVCEPTMLIFVTDSIHFD